MIDCYFNGSVDWILFEVLVLVVWFIGQEDWLGGVVNVVFNFKVFGVMFYLCFVIGVDENGYQFSCFFFEV